MSTDEIRNVNIRRKNLLYLIQSYCMDNGLIGTAESLKTEARLSDEWELCDNVDLDNIYLDYASYYQLKFGKFPKILRKSPSSIKVDVGLKSKKSKNTSSKEKSIVEIPKNIVPDLEVTVTKLKENGHTDESDRRLISLQEVEHDRSSFGDHLFNSPDWHHLNQLISSTIFNELLKLSWSDICGNNNAVSVLKEAVLVPLKFPNLFSSGLRPWRSVLLHGPPGSGKTMMAKVLYAETKGRVTFFNVTSSIMVSKWRGESEKIIKLLFFIAQKHAPSIIFLDEIEGLTSKRDRVTDHESSKRFKNELLQLLDGMEQERTGVFILATSNIPWEIDEAFLRRFEKKMLVQLPNDEERAALIAKLLPNSFEVTPEKMKTMVQRSEDFTGDEIRLVCKEIAMQSVRRIIAGQQHPFSDWEHFFQQIKPTSIKLMMKHRQWQKEFGSQFI